MFPDLLSFFMFQVVPRSLDLVPQKPDPGFLSNVFLSIKLNLIFLKILPEFAGVSGRTIVTASCQAAFQNTTHQSSQTTKEQPNCVIKLFII